MTARGPTHRMNDSRIRIPPVVAEHAVEVLKERGKLWLAELPVLVAACERRWSIELESPFENLSYNYVAHARRADGTAVVLKVNLPTPESITEVEALRSFDGRGAVRLLESDLELRALLLEQVRPGTPLSALGDDVAEISAAADVMRRLWRPAPTEHGFPLAVEWLADARGRDVLLETKEKHPWIRDALSAANELASEPHPQLLLHGDLHHDNILASERDGWLAIDPQGVIGEPAWEIAPILVNNLPEDASTWPALMRRRADQLSEELGLERRRVYIWSAVRALQGAFWSLRDSVAVWKAAVVCGEELAKGP